MIRLQVCSKIWEREVCLWRWIEGMCMCEMNRNIDCLICMIRSFPFRENRYIVQRGTSLSFSHDPLLLEQLLSFSNQNVNAIGSLATMKFYLQSRDCDTVIDYQLILSTIDHVCQRRSTRAGADHIVVFLPGPDEIFMMNDLFSKFNLAHK